MGQNELENWMAYVDLAELLMYADEARAFIDKGETEDALAYAMSMGIKMGWNAHKKMLDKEEVV